MSEARRRHIPVLLAEVLDALQPREGGLVVDGTFGAGGYTQALLDRGAQVVALDRDPAAVRAAAGLVAASHGRLRLVEARFGDLEAVAKDLGLGALDGVVLDIGVSSMQLDEAGARLLAALRRAARHANGQARAAPPPTSCATRTRRRSPTFCSISARSAPPAASRAPSSPTARRSPFVSTLELARMIARVAPERRGELTHPATRTFQALRIAVNDELGELLRGLAAAERLLAPGGRLAVVTFHSLEDRIVKQFLASRSGRGRAASRLLPGRAGRGRSRPSKFRAASRSSRAKARRAANPRSRSAKLRFAVRLDASPRAPDSALEALTKVAGATREAPLMWRLMHAVAIAALIGSAAYVYGVKYRTIYASEQLVKARHLIAKEKDAINLLRAEYAHLARPDRLQALADSKLGMQALALSQIATVGDLPEAQPKVDSIGRTLESLGFLKDSATPAADAGGETPPVR